MFILDMLTNFFSFSANRPITTSDDNFDFSNVSPGSDYYRQFDNLSPQQNKFTNYNLADTFFPLNFFDNKQSNLSPNSSFQGNQSQFPSQQFNPFNPFSNQQVGDFNNRNFGNRFPRNYFSPYGTSRFSQPNPFANTLAGQYSTRRFSIPGYGQQFQGGQSNFNPFQATPFGSSQFPGSQFSGSPFGGAQFPGSQFGNFNNGNNQFQPSIPNSRFEQFLISQGIRNPGFIKSNYPELASRLLQLVGPIGITDDPIKDTNSINTNDSTSSRATTSSSRRVSRSTLLRPNQKLTLVLHTPDGRHAQYALVSTNLAAGNILNLRFVLNSEN